MKPVCPSEDRLKSLIMEAFNDLPTPDPARMQRIATTLNRKTDRKSKPQHAWLFWLLLGGSMTAAAWWAGDTFLATDTKSPTIESGQNVIKNSLPIEKQVVTPQAPNKSGTQQQHKSKISPIIDKRERY